MVELIVVIVITGILSTFLVQFILLPIGAYSDVSRRARLVDIANTVIQKISMDVHQALPNSLRVGDCNGGSDNCVEFLSAPFGGRYRAQKTGSQDDLKIASADNSFDMLVPFSDDDKDAVIRNTDKSAACNTDRPVYLVVNNTGNSGANAWQLDNMAEVSGITVGTGLPSDVSVSFKDSQSNANNFTFPSASPFQRFYLVETPVKYIWSNTDKQIKRYRCYAINTAADADTVPSVTPDVLAGEISNITFSYQPGTTALPIGLLTISVTVKESASNEKITLLQQVQIFNMS